MALMLVVTSGCHGCDIRDAATNCSTKFCWIQPDSQGKV